MQFVQELCSFDVPGRWSEVSPSKSGWEHSYVKNGGSMELGTRAAVGLKSIDEQRGTLQHYLDAFRTINSSNHSGIAFQGPQIRTHKNGRILIGVVEWAALPPSMNRECCIVCHSETTFVAVQLTNIAETSQEFAKTVASIADSMEC